MFRFSIKTIFMTNEDKAKIILEKLCTDELGFVEIPDKDWVECDLTCKEARAKIESAAILMAQFKDEQFKKFLKEKCFVSDKFIDDNFNKINLL